jgi:hypothetical protein
MSNARWMPESITTRWATDPESFGFCSLCGEECHEGVVVSPMPFEPKGTAFFCWKCVEQMNATASDGPGGSRTRRVGIQ